MSEARANDPAEALEERLRCNIDDEQAWRVYGDLLLDRGDRRGELIMLSLQAREQPELAPAVAALETEILASMGLNRRVGAWRHGFLVAAKVELRWDTAGVAALLTQPAGTLLHRLELVTHEGLPKRAFTQLAKLDFGRIRALRFADQSRGDAFLAALAQTQGHRFVALDLPHANLTHHGAIALARLAEGGSLRRLWLQRNRIRAKGLALLAPKLVDLELLDLRYIKLDLASAQALASTPALARLRTLRLDTNKLDEASLLALAESTTLPRAITRFFRGVHEQRLSG